VVKYYSYSQLLQSVCTESVIKGPTVMVVVLFRGDSLRVSRALLRFCTDVVQHLPAHYEIASQIFAYNSQLFESDGCAFICCDFLSVVVRLCLLICSYMYLIS